MRETNRDVINWFRVDCELIDGQDDRQMNLQEGGKTVRWTDSLRQEDRQNDDLTERKEDRMGAKHGVFTPWPEVPTQGTIKRGTMSSVFSFFSMIS